jgi:hypothetical protein
VARDEAARRIMALVEQMRRRQLSGVAVKEELLPHPLPLSPNSGERGGEGPREGDA